MGRCLNLEKREVIPSLMKILSFSFSYKLYGQGPINYWKEGRGRNHHGGPQVRGTRGKAVIGGTPGQAVPALSCIKSSQKRPEMGERREV